MLRDKERKRFGPSNQHKGQVEGTTSNKGRCQGEKQPNVGIKGGDVENKRCHKCGRFGHFHAACLDNKVSVKTNHVCAADRMLEGGFIAKASNLELRSSFLYLEVQSNRKMVSSLVDTGATHSFMSPKLAKELACRCVEP